MNQTVLVKTKKDAQTWLEKIEELQDSMFEKHTSLAVQIDSILTAEEKENFQKLLAEKGIILEKSANFGKFLTETAGEIKKLPVVTLTLSFNPTVEFLNSVADWFRENQKNILVDFKVERDLIGGMIVECQGSYRDFSLRKKYGKILGIS